MNQQQKTGFPLSFRVGSLCFALLAAAVGQETIREYIRLGGRVIAIETRAQSGALTLTPPNWSPGLEATSTTFQVQISGNTAWKILPRTNSWIRVALATPATSTTCPAIGSAPAANAEIPGSGNATVCVWVESNSGTARNGKVTVEAGGAQKDFEITQSAGGTTELPAELNITPTSRSVTISATSGSFDVSVLGEPGAAWTASITNQLPQDWLTMVSVPTSTCPPTGGTASLSDAGAKKICLVAPAQTSANRTATVTITLANNSDSAIVNVAQPGSSLPSCDAFQVLPTARGVSVQGGYFDGFLINTNNGVASNQTWEFDRLKSDLNVSVQPTSGPMDSSSFGITVAQWTSNNGATSRTLPVWFKATNCNGNQDARVDIVQQGASQFTVPAQVNMTWGTSHLLSAVPVNPGQPTNGLIWEIQPQAQLKFITVSNQGAYSSDSLSPVLFLPEPAPQNPTNSYTVTLKRVDGGSQIVLGQTQVTVRTASGSSGFNVLSRGFQEITGASGLVSGFLTATVAPRTPSSVGQIQFEHEIRQLQGSTGANRCRVGASMNIPLSSTGTVIHNVGSRTTHTLQIGDTFAWGLLSDGACSAQVNPLGGSISTWWIGSNVEYRVKTDIPLSPTGIAQQGTKEVLLRVLGTGYDGQPSQIATFEVPGASLNPAPVITQSPADRTIAPETKVVLEAKATDTQLSDITQMEIAVVDAAEGSTIGCRLVVQGGSAQAASTNGSTCTIASPAFITVNNERVLRGEFTFAESFRGGHKLETRVGDSAGNVRTTTGILNVNSNATVRLVNAIPVSRQGPSGIINVDFIDLDGVREMDELYLRISELPTDSSQVCWIRYVASTGQAMGSNNGLVWRSTDDPALELCRSQVVKETAGNPATSIRLRVQVDFDVASATNPFLGLKSIYGWVGDQLGYTTQVPIGEWAVYPVGMSPLSVPSTGANPGVLTDNNYRNASEAVAYSLVSATPVSAAAPPLIPSWLAPFWLPNTATSRWIGPSGVDWTTPTTGGSAAGPYRYQLKFSLTDFLPNTARVVGRYAADNSAQASLNDTTALGSSTSLTEWTTFSAVSGFNSETNTLKFDVTNGAPSPNPTGLHVNIVGAYARAKAVTISPERVDLSSSASVTFTATNNDPANPQLNWYRSEDGGTTWIPMTGFNGSYVAPASIPETRAIIIRVSNGTVDSRFRADAFVTLKAPGAASRSNLSGMLKNTGENISNGEDFSWDVISPQAGATPVKAKVVDTAGVLSTLWWTAATPGTDSRWIGASASGNGSPGGDWIYRTSFNLTGFVHQSADIQFRVLGDDRVKSISVNGHVVAMPPGDHAFYPWSSVIAIPASKLTNGNNTLDVTVENLDASFPGGVRVEFVSRTAIPSGGPMPLFSSTGKTVVGTSPILDERYWVRHLPALTYSGYSTTSCPAATGFAGFNKAKVVTTAVPLSSYYGNDSTAENIARWISTEDTAYTTSAGMYIFRQELDLTGYNPATTLFKFKLTADDGAKVFVNCQPVSGVERAPGGVSPFLDLGSEFTIPGSAFLPGKNYVDFAVPSAQAADYTALRVEMTALTATPSASQGALAATTPVGVAQGSTGTSQISVSGFSSPVTLSQGTPWPSTGISVAFTPSQTSTTSQATITVGATVTPGPYVLPVLGTAGSASASTTITLNVTGTTSGAGRSYVSNGQNRLLATIPSVSPFTSMGQFRWEFRVHDFVPSTSAANNQYFFGFGPGYTQNAYTMVVPRPASVTVFQIQAPDNPGSCSLGPGSATTDFVVRVQKDSTGRYRLGIWNGTTWLQDENCIMNGTAGANLSGIMNFPAGLWGNGLQGNFAYLRLYGNAETFPFTAPPDASGAGSLLRWEFEDNLTEGVGGSANMTMYPALSETPGTATYTGAPGSGGGGGTTYTISGTVTGAAGANPVTLSITNGGGSATTDGSSGTYSKSGLAAGTYTVTPQKNDFTFDPPSRTVTFPGSGTANFVASAATGPFALTVLKGYESLKEGVEGTLSVRLRATTATSATVSFSALTLTPPSNPATPSVAATCDAPKANGVTVPAGGVTVAGSSTLDITLTCRGMAGSAPSSVYIYTTGPFQYDSLHTFQPYLVSLTANATGQASQTLSAPMKLTILPTAWVGPAQPTMTMTPSNVMVDAEETVVLSGAWPFDVSTVQGGRLEVRFVDVGVADPLQTANSCSLGLLTNGGSHLLVDNGTALDSRYINLGFSWAGDVDNSQCLIKASTSSMVASGGNVQFTLKMRLKSGWNNRWVRVYTRAYSDSSTPQISGWRELEMVKIGNP